MKNREQRITFLMMMIFICMSFLAIYLVTLGIQASDAEKLPLYQPELVAKANLDQQSMD